MRPEGLCQCRVPITPSGTEPATFPLLVQCLNQLRHRVPLLDYCEVVNSIDEHTGELLAIEIKYCVAQGEGRLGKAHGTCHSGTLSTLCYMRTIWFSATFCFSNERHCRSLTYLPHLKTTVILLNSGKGIPNGKRLDKLNRIRRWRPATAVLRDLNPPWITPSWSDTDWFLRQHDTSSPRR